MKKANENPPFNQSIAKAFSLLNYFTTDHPDWGVRELAKELGANQSTTYRIMATLESLGVLKKDPVTDRYSLGLKLFELGHRVPIQEALISRIHPVLSSVAEEITETVHLGILREEKVFMIDKVESKNGLKLNSQIGTYSPVHCTGLGKVLLAFQPALGQNEFLRNTQFTPFTNKTITDLKEFEKALKAIRVKGYAIDREEKELGLICVAVPVFNTNNELIAALSAAGPANRFREEALEEYVQTLQSGAKRMQERIGSFDLAIF